MNPGIDSAPMTNVACVTQLVCMEDGKRARQLACNMGNNYHTSLVFRYLDTFPRPAGVPAWPETLPEPSAATGIPSEYGTQIPVGIAVRRSKPSYGERRRRSSVKWSSIPTRVPVGRKVRPGGASTIRAASCGWRRSKIAHAQPPTRQTSRARRPAGETNASGPSWLSHPAIDSRETVIVPSSVPSGLTLTTSIVSLPHTTVTSVPDGPKMEPVGPTGGGFGAVPADGGGAEAETRGTVGAGADSVPTVGV
jgi:hypothetical protein